MQSEQNRGCRDDSIGVRFSIVQNSQLCQLKSLLMREAAALLPLLEAVIVSPLTPLYAGFWIVAVAKFKLFDFELS
jgi:hypothetical protein